MIALGGTVGLWLIVRVALWDAPFQPASLLPDMATPSLPSFTRADAAPADDEAPIRSALPDYAMPTWMSAPMPMRVERPLPRPIMRGEAAGSNMSVANRSFAGARALVGHALLWRGAYGVSRRAGESTLAVRQDPAPARFFAPAAMEPKGRGSRWSGDAWALWRDSEETPLLSGRPTYGRSQIGAVIRYRLERESGRRPQLHLRASSALEGRTEREVALGASARPISSIPVRVAAEARLSETSLGTEARGAAFAVTEFDPLELPGGLIGEAYVQGGYVTGEFATGFVDGQARVTRTLAEVGDFRLETGAGAWGGAQRDAERLDIGPSAAVTFNIGAVRARASADYRFRVAGDAQPASGPALTLSAGF
ncbi:hypothetical protein D6201_06645 [Aurantiacibacter aquimixticola]|uniref:Uncharacterized protein n=1 Tax=Aurantiacibacter aquimixticola TaxID=1958945 RepID=A0A419RTG7_9SPHN|nr:hypothetical protein D6201_06645 [Aurantiacibacter aquimixticola]